MGFFDSFRMKRKVLENNISNDKKILENEKMKDDFFEKLQGLSFIQDDAKRIQQINELIKLSKQIPELNGWSENKEKFWSTEAVFWNTRMPKSTRIFIREHLKKVIPEDSVHISLGSGSCPYLENAICLDSSKEMLDNIRLEAKQKIALDLDKENMPFEDNSIDFISMVFILNYLKNPEKVLLECRRILKNNGKIIIINSGDRINGLYNKFEINNFDENKIKKLLKDSKFKFKIESKKINENELVIVVIEKR